ncbi:MAG: hypothetical protein ACW99Q_10465, partial [Candidatus Kariarchaeaceae archaeon]
MTQLIVHSHKFRKGLSLVVLFFILMFGNFFYLIYNNHSSKNISIENQNVELNEYKLIEHFDNQSGIDNLETEDKLNSRLNPGLSDIQEIRKSAIKGMSANFSLNSKIMEKGFRYEYEENYYDNFTHLQKPNNYNLSLSTFSPNYSDFNVTLDVDTYSEETTYTFESDINKQEAIDKDEIL